MRWSALGPPAVVTTASAGDYGGWPLGLAPLTAAELTPEEREGAEQCSSIFLRVPPPPDCRYRPSPCRLPASYAPPSSYASPRLAAATR